MVNTCIWMGKVPPKSWIINFTSPCLNIFQKIRALDAWWRPSVSQGSTRLTKRMIFYTLWKWILSYLISKKVNKKVLTSHLHYKGKPCPWRTNGMDLWVNLTSLILYYQWASSSMTIEAVLKRMYRIVSIRKQWRNVNHILRDPAKTFVICASNKH